MEKLSLYKVLLIEEARLLSAIGILDALELDVRNKFTDVNEQVGCQAQVCGYQKDVTDALKKTAQLLREKRDSAIKSLKDLEPLHHLLAKNTSKRTCPICLDREIEMFVAPCGHTLCSDCSRHVRGHCFICKKPISDTSRLYYN